MWELKTIKEVCVIKPPKSEVRKKLKGDELVSFVPMNDLGECAKHFESHQERPLSEVSGSYTYFAENDVLLAKITPCFENGKLGIARNLKNGVGFGSSEFVVLRSKGSIDPEYLFYFLSQDIFRRDGAAVMTGAVGHRRVPKEFIEEHLIPTPPLPEQKRIVAILDEAFEGIDAAIANTQANLAAACELFESYLNKVFAGLEQTYETLALSKILDISHGYAFKGPTFKKSEDTSKPIILTPGNYTDKANLSFTSYNTKRLFGDVPTEYLFQEGDLTVVMTDLSSKMKILGKPAFIDKPNILHNQRIGRLLFKSERVVPRFVFHYLRTKPVNDRIKHTSTGTMVRHTAPKRILENLISLPTIAQQQEIVSELDQLEQETQRLERIFQQKLNALHELKQSILAKAFRGELTPEEIAA